MPLMSVARNFFLGREPLKKTGFVRQFDVDYANAPPTSSSPTWAFSCATPSSLSEHFRAANANAWPLRGPSISAPRC